MKYRKKPVVVDAMLCETVMRSILKNPDGLPEWLKKKYDQLILTDKGIFLPTLEGTMHAELDDYIICGVAGEVYPCKPDIFQATYEPVE